jgi:hypothetical protein
MKYMFMAGVSGVSVLMISALLVLSVRDDMRQDAQQMAAVAHGATVQVASN